MDGCPNALAASTACRVTDRWFSPYFSVVAEFFQFACSVLSHPVWPACCIDTPDRPSSSASRAAQDAWDIYREELGVVLPDFFLSALERTQSKWSRTVRRTQKTTLRNCKTFKTQRRLKRNYSQRCLRPPGTCHHMQNQSRRNWRRTTHGFLRKCQPPASPGNPVATTDRSGRTQCQAEKTGIVEQIARWQVSKTEQRGNHPPLGENHSA